MNETTKSLLVEQRDNILAQASGLTDIAQTEAREIERLKESIASHELARDENAEAAAALMVVAQDIDAQIARG